MELLIFVVALLIIILLFVHKSKSTDVAQAPAVVYYPELVATDKYYDGRYYDIQDEGIACSNGIGAVIDPSVEDFDCPTSKSFGKCINQTEITAVGGMKPINTVQENLVPMPNRTYQEATEYFNARMSDVEWVSDYLPNRPYNKAHYTITEDPSSPIYPVNQCEYDAANAGSTCPYNKVDNPFNRVNGKVQENMEISAGFPPGLCMVNALGTNKTCPYIVDGFNPVGKMNKKRVQENMEISAGFPPGLCMVNDLGTNKTCPYIVDGFKPMGKIAKMNKKRVQENMEISAGFPPGLCMVNDLGTNKTCPYIVDGFKPVGKKNNFFFRPKN